MELRDQCREHGQEVEKVLEEWAIQQELLDKAQTVNASDAAWADADRRALKVLNEMS